MSRRFLDNIIAVKEKEIKEAKAGLSQKKIVGMLESLATDGNIRNHSHTKRNFKDAINAPGKIRLIAEIKKSSPSKGIIRKGFDPVKIAGDYQAAGASALSVLTDGHFFGGHSSFIGKVKEAVKLPVLRKDFIIDEYQLYQSALIDADCVLLIAEILEKSKIGDFLALAALLNLEALVEANTKEHLEKAVESGARMIGINNRNLNTFKVDIKTTERLIGGIPKDRIIVSESGIKTHKEVEYLKSLGVNAVLIGEAFMSAPDIPKKVKEVMGW